jgi:hypothetical protein
MSEPRPAPDPADGASTAESLSGASEAALLINARAPREWDWQATAFSLNFAVEDLRT